MCSVPRFRVGAETFDEIRIGMPVEVTAEFLAFSKAKGNDLSTPQPGHGFPGLSPGDRWCLCAARWREAFEAGKAPRVILGATHEVTLELVELGDLKRYAIDLA